MAADRPEPETTPEDRPEDRPGADAQASGGVLPHLVQEGQGVDSLRRHREKRVKKPSLRQRWRAVKADPVLWLQDHPTAPTSGLVSWALARGLLGPRLGPYTGTKRLTGTAKESAVLRAVNDGAPGLTELMLSLNRGPAPGGWLELSFPAGLEALLAETRILLAAPGYLNDSLVLDPIGPLVDREGATLIHPVPPQTQEVTLLLPEGQMIPGDALILWRQIPQAQVWRLLARQAGGLGKAEAAALFQDRFESVFAQYVSDADYRQWAAREDPAEHPGFAQAERLRLSPAVAPLFTILMPLAADTPTEAVERSLASLQAQDYPAWRLRLVSAPPGPPERVRDRWTADPRISLQISDEDTEAAQIREALEVVQAQWVLDLAPGDRLAREALALMAETLAQNDNLACLLAGEDFADPFAGRRGPLIRGQPDPVPLPALDRLALLARDPSTGPVALHLGAVRAAGGVRDIDGPAWRWSLLLRLDLALGADAFARIDQVLLHRAHAPRLREAGRELLSAGGKVVSSIAKHQITGGKARITRRRHVGPDGAGEWLGITPALPGNPPAVSLLLWGAEATPVQGQSLLAATQWPDLTLISAASGAPGLQVPGDGASGAWINRALTQVSTPLVLLLEAGTQPLEPTWLATLVRWAIQAKVGAVGAKLVWPEASRQEPGGPGLLESAGLEIAPDWSLVEAVGAGTPADHLGEDLSAVLARDVAAVSTRCLLAPTRTLMALGGMVEDAFVDDPFIQGAHYGARVRKAGGRVLWIPDACLTLSEAVSADGVPTGIEVASPEVLDHALREGLAPLHPAAQTAQA